MKLKLPALLISCLIFLFSIVQISHLEAGGWGKTDDVIEHEGATWNGVYYDMNGLNFLAYIPGYSGAELQNGITKLKGSLNDESGYVIITTFNPNFEPPKSKKEFVKMIQVANPNYLVQAIDSKKQGAKYAIDMIPANPEYTAFWRYLSTDDRLIKMGTDDPDENRHLYFFESLYIE
jgi:hypothetical protein